MNIDRRYATAHLIVGLAYLDQRSKEDAIAEFQAALHIDPGLAYAHLWLGLALWDYHGRAQEAIREARTAARLGSSLAAQVLAAAGLPVSRLEHTRESLVTASPQNVAKLLRMSAPPKRVWWEKAEMELCLVPAGEFVMNISEHLDLPGSRLAYLDAYYIGRYPVTQRQYARFVRETGHAVPHGHPDWHYPYNWNKEHKAPPPGMEDHPVVLVRQRDIVAYCEWAGLRLPTEAEWEKAARGTDGRTYPWGEDPPSKELCNFNRHERGTTWVGKYSPEGDSPYGCADMVGNVGEICVEPVLPSKRSLTARLCVVRGRSWAEETLLRYVRREGRLETDVGFRCARGSQ